MDITGLILCEGETDQVLIGSYMTAASGWKYVRPTASIFPNESIHWYDGSEGGMYGIWQVGGKDFDSALLAIMARERLEHKIDYLLIITDHDDEDAETEKPRSVIELLRRELGFGDDIGNEYLSDLGQWTTIPVTNSFGNYEMKICFLLVPREKQGALETYMLSALSEQDKEKERVILQVKEFLKEFSSEVYIRKRRERVKAELAVSVSIFRPDKMFSTMIELIRSVDWSRFEESDRQFEPLRLLK